MTPKSLRDMTEADFDEVHQPPAAQPVAPEYVQNVPDHCDRIVWRGEYYHLPIHAGRKQELIEKAQDKKRIAQLEADLAAALAMCDSYANENQRISDERDAARAEAAAWRDDAERYRWLRKQDPNRDRIQTDESQSAWVHVKGVRVDCMSDALYVTSDYATMGNLDAAIDAARGGGNG